MFRVVCLSLSATRKQRVASTSGTAAFSRTQRYLSTPASSSPASNAEGATSREASAEESEFESLTRPTWSVHQLLSTYPAPTLSPETLTRLHKISALKPPPEDSPEFAQLKREMEELVRLVEAVKLVDTTGISSDGRIMPKDRGIDLSVRGEEVPADEKDITRHAAKAADGFYIADTPSSGRRKKQGQS